MSNPRSSGCLPLHNRGILSDLNFSVAESVDFGVIDPQPRSPFVLKFGEMSTSGEPLTMLAHLLAIAVASGSLGFYGSLFLVQSVYRSKSDFAWCGLGLFYALVLWVCAGRLTGGVLLGQTASVALLGWLGWQTFNFRRTVPLNPNPEPPLVNQDSVVGRLIRRFRQDPATAAPTPTPPPPTTETEAESPVVSEDDAAIAIEAPPLTPEPKPETTATPPEPESMVEPGEPIEEAAEEPTTTPEPDPIVSRGEPQAIAPLVMPVIAPEIELTPAEQSDLETHTVSSLLDLAEQSESLGNPDASQPASEAEAIAPATEPTATEPTTTDIESVEELVSPKSSPSGETEEASDDDSETDETSQATPEPDASSPNPEPDTTPQEDSSAAKETDASDSDTIETEVSTSFADRIVEANFDPDQEDIVDVEVLSSSPAQTDS